MCSKLESLIHHKKGCHSQIVFNINENVNHFNKNGPIAYYHELNNSFDVDSSVEWKIPLCLPTSNIV